MRVYDGTPSRADAYDGCRDPALDEQLLAKLRERHDEAVASGITHNRHRDSHHGNHPGCALG